MACVLLLILGMPALAATARSAGEPASPDSSGDALRHVLKPLWHPDAARLEVAETRLIEPNPDVAESLAPLGRGWRLEEEGNGFWAGEDSLWATALVADLEVVVLTPRELTLSLVLRPNVAPDPESQRVEVMFNDARLGVCRFSAQEGWAYKTFTFTVPRRVQKRGQNTITFMSRFAASARALGRGDDKRPAAFSLKRLQLSVPGQPAQAPPRPVRTSEFADEKIRQAPNTLLKFPMRVPKGGAARLVMDPPKPERRGASWHVYLLRDGTEGIRETPIFAPENTQANEDGVTFDLARFEGEVVAIVFDTTEQPAPGAVRWRRPRFVGQAGAVARVASPVPTSPPLESYGARNVLLIICDALRKSGVGCYGYARDTTPCIDSLARQGVRFHRAYSAAPYTYSSSWSLLTSTYPFQHRASETPLRAADELPRLQQVLRAEGIVTGCISAQHWVSPKTGIAELFDEFQPAYESVEALESGAQPELLTAKAVAFLEKHRDERFFLYLHYRPPHEPYYAAPAFRGGLAPDLGGVMTPSSELMRAVRSGVRGLTRGERQHLRVCYDENLAGVDAEVGKVVAALGALELQGDTLVIVTSDHGEAFLEHGALGHGQTVYEEVENVPLILWGAGVERILPPDVYVPVSTIRIYPTVCDLMGVEAPKTAVGASLLASESYAGGGVRAYAQGGFQITTHTWDPVEAYWWTRYKLIRDTMGGRVELYDLERDPEEKNNLASLAPVLTDYLLAEALAWRQRQQAYVVGEPAVQETQGQVTVEEREALKALGYL